MCVCIFCLSISMFLSLCFLSLCFLCNLHSPWYFLNIPAPQWSSQIVQEFSQVIPILPFDFAPLFIFGDIISLC